MIKKECYTQSWIETKKNEFGGTPYTIEKVIYAFTLLEALVISGLDFVFKGGTSLLLHLDKINRLSIDIDIVCNEDDAKIEMVVESISGISPFKRSSKDDRGERGLPNREHFRFYYNSIDSGKEENVILDIVRDKCGLPLSEKEISCYVFDTEGDPLKVKIPTIEALLGDKLTAFAPNTIGVPFVTEKGKKRELQVIKQLFDVGELFSNANELSKIKEAYSLNFKVENGYHENKYSINEVLEDTKHHCMIILHHIMKGYDYPDVSAEMLSGIHKLTNHLIGIKFRYNNEAKIAAAKAYLLCEYILGNCNLKEIDLKYEVVKLKTLSDKKLISKLSHLERLKAINPEAYYYLLIASEQKTK